MQRGRSQSRGCRAHRDSKAKNASAQRLGGRRFAVSRVQGSLVVYMLPDAIFLVLSALAPNLMTRDDGQFRLRHLQDSERSAGATVVKQATAIGWDGLIVAGLEAEEVAVLSKL